MAQPDVNLGTVGFGLAADTDPLDKSFAALEKFGNKVDQVGNSTSETAQRLYSRFTQVEKQLTQMFPKIEAVTAAIQKSGASARYIDEITNGYTRLAQTLEKTKNMSELGQHEINRGIIGMNAIISRGARAAKEQADQNRLATQQADALFRAQQRVADLNARFKLRGAPADFGDNASAALQKYSAALAKGTLSTEDLRRHTRLFQADINSLNREFQNHIHVLTETNRIQSQISARARQVNALNLRAQRLGIDPSFGQANVAALSGLQTALFSKDSTQIISAQNKLANTMAALRERMYQAEQQGLSFAGMFHTLSRATILAAGPLSGVGARMAVLAALFESGTAKAALFVAGTTGAIAAFGFIAAGAIKASMEMERFDALLISATGSVALTGDEFEYVKGQADRFGLSVRGLVEPYAKFATAARLAGFTLEGQRNIFESIITAGTALRFDTQKTERAFLAIEQMISKGTVQTQELKLQLGQVLPGAMEIAAIAMGKTTAELMKMMQQGELVTSEFLPKLADTLKVLFGPGAEQGAKSLQAELGRLSTALFEVQLAFNEATGSSDVFRKAVILTTDVLKYLTQNMDQVLAILAGIAGALGGGIVATGLIAFTRYVIAAGGAVQVLYRAIATLSAGGAVLASVLGGPITAIVRLGAVLLGAYAGYRLFNQETDIFSRNITDFLDKNNQWIDSVEQIGFAHKRTAEQAKQATMARIQEVGAELELIMMQIAATDKLTEARKKASEPGVVRRGASPLTGLRMQKQQAGEPAEEPQEVKDLKARQTFLQEALNRLNDLYTRIGNLKTKDFGISGQLEKENRAWEGWLDSIRNAIHETEKWDEKLRALGQPGSQNIIDVAEAFEKADKVLERMPKKGNQLYEAIAALKGAGFWVDDLRLSLANMFLHTQAAETEFKNMQQTIRDQSSAAKELAKEWQNLDAKIKGAEATLAGKDPADLKRLEAREQFINKITGLYTVLGVSQEEINRLLAIYLAQWDKLSSTEKHVAQVKELKKELEHLEDTFGNKSERAFRQYFKDLKTLNDSVKENLRTEEEAAVIKKALYNDLFAKLLESGNGWAKKTKELLLRMEDSISDSVADWATGAGGSFKDMLKMMEREMISFITKMLVLRPIMKGLFGGMMDGNFSGGGMGMGMVGNALMSAVPGLMGALGFAPSVSVAVEGAGLMNFATPLIDAGPAFAAVLHGGGVAGIGPMRSVSAAAFRDAPRMHGGGDILGPDEVPIIGKRGERVLTREQQRMMGSGMQINMPVTIVTRDASSFRASKNQWMSDLYTAGSAAARRFK